MQLTRRDLLIGTTALVGVAACASLNTTLAPIADDVSAIANGLASILPQVGSVVGIPADTVTKVSGWVADIKSMAQQVSAAATPTAAQPTIKQVEADVNAVVGALAGFGSILPPPIGMILDAATVLLPAIEAAVGLLIPGAAPDPAAVAQARLILKGAAARH